MLEIAGSSGVGGLVWAADGWIYYAGTATNDSEDGALLWRTRQGAHPQRLDVDLPGCDQVWQLVSLFPIADYVVGLGLQCEKGQDYTVLAAWDTSKGAASYLRRVRFDGGGIVWPAGDAAPVGGYRACGEGLARLGQVGGTCLTYSEALAPVTAADSAVLYWMSQQCDTLAHETDSYATDWLLCRWDPAGAGPQSVAAGFTRPAGVAIISTEQTAIVAGTRHGQAGLWRVDLTTGGVNAVERGNLRNPAASPDQRRVAVVEDRSGSDVIRSVEVAKS